MVYEWTAHKETCYRLYIEEKRPLQDIIVYMRDVHDFTPSKRAYQIQFRRWGFPAKQNPAYKNDRLVKRVRELWQENANSREMLRILKDEEGFEINARELTRLRSRHRLLLRVPNGDRVQVPASSLEDAAPDSEASDPEVEMGYQTDPAPESSLHPSQASATATATTTPPNDDNATADTLPAKRRRKMLTRTADNTKPASRFPSEMKFNEARQILGLDSETYRSLRSRFHQICSEESVTKKTVAGPERWVAVKQRLISEFADLQNTFSKAVDGPGDAELALDVICTDVTKRMRLLETRMTLAQAKNILGVNPEESRALRSTLHQILYEANFTSKTETTPQQWSEIKRKWGQRSERVKSILLDPESSQNSQQRSRALELLARDVAKRLRETNALKPGLEDETRRTRLQEDGQAQCMLNHRERTASMSPSNESGELSNDLAEDVFDSPSELSAPSHVGYAPAGDAIVGQAPASLPSATMGMSTSTAEPPQLTRTMGTPAASGMAVDAQIGHPILLTPTIPADYMSPSYLQHAFTPASATHQGYPQTTTTASSFAVYLRLHPSSSFITNASLWIATAHSHSLQELRRAAVETFPSALCLRVEGILRDGKGGELSLPIEGDQELGAYLAHLQSSAPTFNVQLAWRAS
ncbi:hypothetical protein HJFPF1_01161 [Paramyrothecium foliicola]|nr:hypothetical protein HJFPF1_01161 [Paramyrothecium foliicola]